MTLIIENPQTGETRQLEKQNGRYPMPNVPWRVKNTIANEQKAKAKGERLAKAEAMAADFGLPVSMFNFIGAWLLGCPYCAAAGEVQELYEKGKITLQQHKELFIFAANAKDQQNLDALRKLKGTLWQLRSK